MKSLPKHWLFGDLGNPFFESSTFKRKFNAEDIIMGVKEGKPFFYALLCIPVGAIGERKYTSKDLEKVEKLREHIRKHDLKQWKVVEDRFGFWLYYFPKEGVFTEENVHDLGFIINLFNSMIKTI